MCYKCSNDRLNERRAMATYYAISDPHGCLDVLAQALSSVDYSNPENRLFLLGDYVPHYRSAAMSLDAFLESAERSVRFVKAHCEAHRGQALALMGNHEFDLLFNIGECGWRFDRDLASWMRKLPPYHETDRQVFVHAGIDEDAGDLWHLGTDDITFHSKYPPTFGPFLKDIVAGHVGTYHMFGEWGCHDAFWDGASHYYIDGTTEDSGKMPVLAFDTERGAYTSRIATKNGVGPTSSVLPHLVA